MKKKLEYCTALCMPCLVQYHLGAAAPHISGVKGFGIHTACSLGYDNNASDEVGCFLDDLVFFVQHHGQHYNGGVP